MKLTKKQREIVKNMFDGKCTYCGCTLPENWHVDHFEPVVRWLDEHGEVVMHKPHNDSFENCVPACPSCNIAKSSMRLEEWRDMLMRNLKAMATSSKFILLAKHGLVSANPQPVVFYFEAIGGQDERA